MATKAIPVVAAKVAATLSDFPVLVQPSVMTGWTSLSSAEADSIRFYSDSGLTTELAREVVSEDEIWVKVPSLTTSTTIYADYDGVRSDYATGATYGRNAVWSDYSLVCHMTDSTTSTVVDSTGKNSSGSKTASNQPIEVSGVIGEAQDNTAAGDQIDFADDTDIQNIFSGGGTIQWWENPDTRGNLSGSSLFQYPFQKGYGYLLFSATNISAYRFERGFSTTGGRWDVSLTSFPLNTWTMGTIVYDDSNTSNNPVIYINGSSATVTRARTPSGSASTDVGSAFTFLNQNGGARTYDGTGDELRLRPDELSPDWITTEYNNQSDVSTFWGTVTDAGGGGSATLGLKLGSTTINKLMLGSTEIKKVYLGSTTIYENL